MLDHEGNVKIRCGCTGCRACAVEGELVACVYDDGKLRMLNSAPLNTFTEGRTAVVSGDSVEFRGDVVVVTSARGQTEGRGRDRS